MLHVSVLILTPALRILFPSVFRHVNATRSYLHFRQIEFSIDNENAGKNAQVKLYFMPERRK